MSHLFKGMFKWSTAFFNDRMNQIHYPMFLHHSFMAILGLLIVLLSVVFAIFFWQFVSLVSLGLIAAIIFISLLTIENIADFFSER